MSPTPFPKIHHLTTRDKPPLPAHASPMEVIPLGDSALLIHLRNDFEKAPTQCLETVLDAMERLEAAHIAGVLELAPAYTTIGLFFDPIRVVEAGAPVEGLRAWLTTKIENALQVRTKQKKKCEPRLIEIPVCYEGEFALDLEELAQRANLSVNEVIRIHAAGEYRVHCVGFTPGFAFLSGLDVKLAAPRRATPRKEVTAGSVAIGGKQTGIYPLRSPGGWNVIGRTPLRMFDLKNDPPALLRTGDRVRFRAITREKFESLKQ
jgi:inhibitor of KinA